jgi:hypothetical protein
MGVTEYPDEKQPEARTWLEKGWEWMKENPDHPRAGEFFDEWLKVLRKYEETYGMGDADVSDAEAPAQVRMSG